MNIQYLCPLLQVFDMNASLKFYSEVLGFSIHQHSQGDGDNPDWVWLKWNDVSLMLNTAYEAPHRPQQPDPVRAKAHDDTCLYIGCPDIDGAYQTLLSKGVSLDPPVTAPYGMKQIYFHDPDGYAICFQWPDPGQ